MFDVMFLESAHYGLPLSLFIKLSQVYTDKVQRHMVGGRGLTVLSASPFPYHRIIYMRRGPELMCLTILLTILALSVPSPPSPNLLYDHGCCFSGHSASAVWFSTHWCGDTGLRITR